MVEVKLLPHPIDTNKYVARIAYCHVITGSKETPVDPCVGETWGGVTFPVNTLIGVAALAFPEMIVEIDVTAIVAAK